MAESLLQTLGTTELRFYLFFVYVSFIFKLIFQLC